MSNSKLTEEQLRSLAMEALLLSEQIAAMDSRIEQAIAPPRNALVEFLQQKFFDRTAMKALEQVFGGLLKAVIGSAAIPTRTVVSLFHSSRQPSARMAYFDTRPDLAREYEIKSKRLAQIHQEIFNSMPPSWKSLKMDNLCEKEACYRSGGTLK